MRKATLSLVMSVLLSVCMEQLGSHWTDFHDIWRLVIFREPVKKIQVSLKSDQKKWHFTWKSIYIYVNILFNYYKNKKSFRESWIENQNILYNKTFFFFWKSYRL